MKELLKREYEFLHKPLNFVSRVVLVLAALSVAVSVLFPLWRMHLIAPQYAEGLTLDIYAWKIQGGG
ncbi:MAG TPA: hypothetical protein VFD27_20620, partial [Chthoniobacteraceae bacterium]|nr:hypothetical protein [Chthoniobacteraceae bacterium]